MRWLPVFCEKFCPFNESPPIVKGRLSAGGLRFNPANCVATRYAAETASRQLKHLPVTKALKDMLASNAEVLVVEKAGMISSIRNLTANSFCVSIREFSGRKVKNLQQAVELGAGLSRLSQQAVLVQELLDKQWQFGSDDVREDDDFWKRMVEFQQRDPAIANTLLSAIIPTRVQVSQFQILIGCEIGIQRDVTVAIGCRPVDFGYEARFGKSSSTRCQFELEVKYQRLDAKPQLSDGLMQ